MNARPTIRVLANHFSDKAVILAEIARDDLWPVTRHQGGFPAAPLHWHRSHVRVYVLAGTLKVEGGADFAPVWAEAGSRIEIPAGAVHTVSATGPSVTIGAFASAADTENLPQLPPDEAPGS